jgi:Mn2+/Fe2+ NRAMP family transporter
MAVDNINQHKSFVQNRRSSLLAAIFLMATSAIGPGFITQTATFTATLGVAFAFGILASILIDFVVQQNIWRVVTLTQMNAAEVANRAIPGSGYLLAVLVIFGGLVFNIGNIAGAGLGLNALFGLSPKLGGLISAAIAIYIFASRRAGVALDRMLIALGVVMIVLTLYVALVSHPPLGMALRETVFPSNINFAAITTIVGGTVGGYISYAGAHRLLDKGISGKEHIKEVSSAANRGIIVVGIMRYVLFLAIFGVVASGVTIDLSSHNANPASQAFLAAAGNVGLRIFGIVLWAAALSSVVGAAWTSVSFISVFRPGITERQRNIATLIFIAFTLVVYLCLVQPPQLCWCLLAGSMAWCFPGVNFIPLGWLAPGRPDGRLPLPTLVALAGDDNLHHDLVYGHHVGFHYF